jgi:hypothetical protein
VNLVVKRGNGTKQDHWGELLLYSGTAFLLGILLGLQALLANDVAAKETDWGSYADWVAASGAVVAAASTIVIALLGHRELKRRARESHSLAVACSANLVIADMEIVARLSRGYDRKDSTLTMDHILHWASHLNLINDFDDLSIYAGLPPQVLQSLAKAKVFSKMLPVAAEAWAKSETGARPDYLMYVMESLGDRLRLAADYLHSATSVVEVPLWEGWIPLVDPTPYLDGMRSAHKA